MKFHVNSNCIGCGLCASTCPDVFQMTDENAASAHEENITAASETSALEAKNSCPVSAIEVIKGGN